MAADALSRFVVDGNEALEMKLVRRKEDLEDDSTSFGPEMCHQVFGENENIFGYTDLNIQLYYTAAALNTYLGINYTDKVEAKDCNVAPDNVEQKIAEIIPPGYMMNLDEFVRSIDEDHNFKPYGEKKHSFVSQSAEGGDERTFEIYYCESTTSGWLQYHGRLQTFLLWYVDGASFISVDDDQWTYFAVYEKYKSSEGDDRYAIAGYATVYRYYAYPKHTRPRISQVLVLPPFRKLGICANLCKVIVKHFSSLAEVVDITVEDPSPEFQRIRDYVDVLNCAKLPAFQPDKLHDKFTEEMASQARSKFRINGKQARRVYEIIRLMHTNRSHQEAYQAYRLYVKNRLNAPFQKKRLEMRKLEKALGTEQLAATISLGKQDETHARLSSQYRALEDEYRRIIHRVTYS